MDHIGHTSPVDGVVVVSKDYLAGRKVFARVVVTYRYGREEDEMMDLHFTKDVELAKSEVGAAGKQEVSDVVECVMSKLGEDARPFCLHLPPNAPASVTLDPERDSSVSNSLPPHTPNTHTLPRVASLMLACFSRCGDELLWMECLSIHLYHVSKPFTASLARLWKVK